MLSVGEAEALAKSAPREPVTAPLRRDVTEAVIPEFLRWLYSTSAYVRAMTTRNVLGIVRRKVEFPHEASLRSFVPYGPHFAVTTKARPSASSYTSDIGLRQPSFGTNVEMQYAEAIASTT